MNSPFNQAKGLVYKYICTVVNLLFWSEMGLEEGSLKEDAINELLDATDKSDREKI